MSAGAPLVLVGAGGLGREVAELVRAVNQVEPTWDLVGFVDDDVALEGVVVAGLPVLGPIAAVADLDAAVVLCTARPAIGCSRASIAAQLALDPERRPALVHPAASLAGSTVVGAGSVLFAGVVATADVVVGEHVVVMPQSVLTHDDRLDDHATLASGVRLGGGVHVGSEAYLGAAASVREGLEIGPAALVGMGSVVLHDVPARQIWAGVPARPLDRPLTAAGSPSPHEVSR